MGFIGLGVKTLEIVVTHDDCKGGSDSTEQNPNSTEELQRRGDPLL
jgi:translation elongation factor EF-1beta